MVVSTTKMKKMKKTMNIFPSKSETNTDSRMEQSTRANGEAT
jgi:hypothetical protein